MKKRILIIDDDEAIVDVVKIVLTDAGYNVIQTNNGDQIEEKVMSEKPDLILLDNWMAGIDGQTISKILKTNRETKHIPIIMVSANVDIKKTVEYAAVDGFLAKPFTIDDLLNIIKKYLPKD